MLYIIRSYSLLNQNFGGMCVIFTYLLLIELKGDIAIAKKIYRLMVISLVYSDFKL